MPASRSVDLLLALQGGGAHGAFTWGVLDRLLEEPDFGIEAVSATSSGAVNAVAMAHGWIEDGREGARAHLARIWQRIGEKSSLASWGFAPSASGGAWLLELARHLTPAQFNPLGLNPLADLLDELIDFERLRAAPPFRLHIAATRVRDGALVLFGNHRITRDAVLASTCLPQLFDAVEIDGETYWDGGYAGNPALAPLVYEARARDLLCILVQPLERPLPASARAIADRAMELAFTTTFLRELESLATAQRMIQGKLALTSLGRRLQSLRLHLLEPGESLAEAGGKAKLDTRPTMLRALCALGRERADAWLAAHRSALGRRSTYSIPAAP